MKKLWIAGVLLGCWAEAGSIRVAIAANISYVMPVLREAFVRTHPSIDVQTTVGGSGKLATQIAHGAPYDLFLSANMAYPQKLYEGGTATTKPIVYAQGALAYLSTQPRDFTHGIALLSDPAIGRIAVANPRTAPYGKAAFEALRKAKLLEPLRPKLVYGESIAQTVTYAVRAADIGLVALSALYAPQMARYTHGTHWHEVDPSLYQPIDQGMVILKRAETNPDVRAFYDFLLSAPARTHFAQYGYRLP